jgi:hypothetical protein
LKGNLQEILCKQFCRYYKPAGTENLACKGFLVIEAFMKKGKKIPFQKTETQLCPQTEGTLIGTLCITCPFYENDCDFVRQKKDCSPCGGFTLLRSLLGKNIISIDDIKNII